MYAKLATYNWCDIHVIFACSAGAQPYYDETFKITIKWPNLKLDQFSHEFLVGTNHVSNTHFDLSAPNLEERLQVINPRVVIVYGYAQKFQRRAALWAKVNKKQCLMISDAELRSPRNYSISFIKRILVPHFLSPVCHNG